MNNLNFKTGLIRKGVSVASIVMMLSTATVLTMAPMSQAQAGNGASSFGLDFAAVAKGGGRSPKEAKYQARMRISCNWYSGFRIMKETPRSWFKDRNGKYTWFSHDIEYICLKK